MLAAPSGQLSALMPVPESTYRRLLSVASQLMTALVPHGGLQAKAHRLPEQQAGTSFVGVDTASSGRAVVDGEVLARWGELSAVKRAEVASKGGYDGVGYLRSDLEAILGWNSTAYF